MKMQVFLTVGLMIMASFFMISLIPNETEAYPLNSFTTGVATGLNSTGYFDSIGVCDFNGDSYDDIITGGGGYSSEKGNLGLFAFSSNGAGTWTSYTLTSSYYFGAMVTGDCNGNGSVEVYAGHEKWASAGSYQLGIKAYEWTGTGFVTAKSPLSTGYVADMECVNVSGNAKPDLVVGHQSAGLKYYESSGTSPITWTEKSTGLGNSGETTCVDTGDLNKDGLLDIVSGQYSNGGMDIYTQNPTGAANKWTSNSSGLPSDATGNTIMGVEVGDVDNDGNLDIVYSRQGSGMRVLLGNGGSGGTLTWTSVASVFPSNFGTSGSFCQLQLADIDMDGDLDLLAPKDSTGLYLFLGNGTVASGTSFRWTQVTGKGLPTTDKYYGSAYLDFDNDGDLDLSGATWGAGIKVYETNLVLPETPTANAGKDQTKYLGNVIYLNGTNSSDAQDCPLGDKLGTLLTYDWNLTGQPAGSTMTDADLLPADSSAAPHFTPTHDGKYNLTLAVSDSGGHWSREDYVNITVIFTNTKPIADAGLDQSVNISDIVTLNGTLSSDGQDALNLLTLDWNVSAGNPSAVTLSDEAAQKPTFTAPTTVGDYFFTLAVRDTLGAWSIDDSVKINVHLPPNVLPTADAGADFTAYSNTTVSLNGTLSSDTDGSLITWDWNCTNKTVVFTSENSSAPSFTPTAKGDYAFTLRVRDDRGGWSPEDSVIVHVIEENMPPVADAGVDFTAMFNDVCHLNGSGSHDPEGGVLTYEWTCLNDLDVTLTNSASAKPSFTAAKVKTYQFHLAVQDDLGLWSQINDTVNVTVIEEAINQIPVANAGKDQTVHVNDTVKLNGTLSNDTDGNIVTWDWNCTDYPTLTFVSENSAQPTFKATVIGTYNITLRVQDNLTAWSPEDIVVVTVVPEDIIIPDPITNNPPTVKLTTPADGANITAPIDLTWTASDPDSDPLTFKIELLNSAGTVVKTLADGLGSTLRTWNWNTSAEASGTYRLRITASDGKLATVDITKNFTIYHAPVVVDDDDITDDDDVQEESYFMYYLIAAIVGLLILIVIIVVIVLIVMRSKKKEAPPPQQEPVVEAPPPQLDAQAQNMADNVGQPMAAPSPYADAQPAQPGWQQTDTAPVFQEPLQMGQGPQTPQPTGSAPTNAIPPTAAQPVQKPAGGKCKQCGQEQMVFNDDGTGSCAACGRQFVWDPSRAPQQNPVQQ